MSGNYWETIQTRNPRNNRARFNTHGRNRGGHRGYWGNNPYRHNHFPNNWNANSPPLNPNTFNNNNNNGNYFQHHMMNHNNTYYPNNIFAPPPPPLYVQRPPSPLPGSEEYTLRNIQQASELIKRQLNLNPQNGEFSEDPSLTQFNTNNASNHVEVDIPKSPEYEQPSRKIIQKRKSKHSDNINVSEIHDKIIKHISNLSFNKKLNLINQGSEGYDIAIQQIQKQKRLEISRALRDMSKSSEDENCKIINAIIPDIGIKIEDLPPEIIAELCSTLDVDFEQNSCDDFAEPSDLFNLISETDTARNDYPDLHDLATCIKPLEDVHQPVIKEPSFEFPVLNDVNVEAQQRNDIFSFERDIWAECAENNKYKNDSGRFKGGGTEENKDHNFLEGFDFGGNSLGQNGTEPLFPLSPFQAEVAEVHDESKSPQIHHQHVSSTVETESNTGYDECEVIKTVHEKPCSSQKIKLNRTRIGSDALSETSSVTSSINTTSSFNRLESSINHHFMSDKKFGSSKDYKKLSKDSKRKKLRKERYKAPDNLSNLPLDKLSDTGLNILSSKENCVVECTQITNAIPTILECTQTNQPLLDDDKSRKRHRDDINSRSTSLEKSVDNNNFNIKKAKILNEEKSTLDFTKDVDISQFESQSNKKVDFIFSKTVLKKDDGSKLFNHSSSSRSKHKHKSKEQTEKKKVVDKDKKVDFKLSPTPIEFSSIIIHSNQVVQDDTKSTGSTKDDSKSHNKKSHHNKHSHHNKSKKYNDEDRSSRHNKYKNNSSSREDDHHKQPSNENLLSTPPSIKKVWKSPGEKKQLPFNLPSIYEAEKETLDYDESPIKGNRESSKSEDKVEVDDDENDTLPLQMLKIKFNNETVTADKSPTKEETIVNQEATQVLPVDIINQEVETVVPIIDNIVTDVKVVDITIMNDCAIEESVVVSDIPTKKNRTIKPKGKRGRPKKIQNIEPETIVKSNQVPTVLPEDIIDVVKTVETETKGMCRSRNTRKSSAKSQDNINDITDSVKPEEIQMGVVGKVRKGRHASTTLPVISNEVLETENVVTAESEPIPINTTGRSRKTKTKALGRPKKTKSASIEPSDIIEVINTESIEPEVQTDVVVRPRKGRHASIVLTETTNETTENIESIVTEPIADIATGRSKKGKALETKSRKSRNVSIVPLDTLIEDIKEEPIDTEVIQTNTVGRRRRSGQASTDVIIPGIVENEPILTSGRSRKVKSLETTIVTRPRKGRTASLVPPDDLLDVIKIEPIETEDVETTIQPKPIPAIATGRSKRIKSIPPAAVIENNVIETMKPPQPPVANPIQTTKVTRPRRVKSAFSALSENTPPILLPEKFTNATVGTQTDPIKINTLLTKLAAFSGKHAEFDQDRIDALKTLQGIDLEIADLIKARQAIYDFLMPKPPISITELALPASIKPNKIPPKKRRSESERLLEETCKYSEHNSSSESVIAPAKRRCRKVKLTSVDESIDSVVRASSADAPEPIESPGNKKWLTNLSGLSINLIRYDAEELKKRWKEQVQSSTPSGVLPAPCSQQMVFTEWVGSILVIKVIQGIVLAGNDKGILYVYDLVTGVLMDSIVLAQKPITSISVEKCNSSLVIYVGSLDGCLYMVQFEDYSVLKQIHVDDPIQCMESSWGFLFIGSHTGNLIRFCLKNDVVDDSVSISTANVLMLRATQEGARRVLLVATRNSPVTVRDAMTGLLMRSMEGTLNPTVYTLLFHNNHIYCGTSQHDVLVYTFQDGQLVHKHEQSNMSGVVCMTIVRNILFVGCYNGNIYVYNTKTNEFITSMAGPGGLFLSMEVYGDKVIAGTKQNQFKAWSLPPSVMQQMTG